MKIICIALLLPSFFSQAWANDLDMPTATKLIEVSQVLVDDVYSNEAITLQDIDCHFYNERCILDVVINDYPSKCLISDIKDEGDLFKSMSFDDQYDLTSAYTYELITCIDGFLAWE